jgi:tRNA pseudouridine65 synthase
LKPVLEIIFEDEHYIAINKPAGVLVHRTNLAKEEQHLLAVQLLRDQMGQQVSPIHRIDRPTSGILLFGKNAEATSLLQPLFPTDQIKKIYLGLVRGYMEEHGIIDHPLKKKLYGELQVAKTEFWKLDQTEIPYPSSSKYPTSRYALMKIYPHTGRMHQIRRHMAHARHYVIGDSTHGDNKQNNFFRNTFGLNNLLLHAWQLEFEHPVEKKKISIKAEVPVYFMEILDKLSLNLPNSN